jgi:hypothetical protein
LAASGLVSIAANAVNASGNQEAEMPDIQPMRPFAIDRRRPVLRL